MEHETTVDNAEDVLRADIEGDAWFSGVPVFRETGVHVVAALLDGDDEPITIKTPEELVNAKERALAEAGIFVEVLDAADLAPLDSAHLGWLGVMVMVVENPRVNRVEAGTGKRPQRASLELLRVAHGLPGAGRDRAAEFGAGGGGMLFERIGGEEQSLLVYAVSVGKEVLIDA